MAKLVSSLIDHLQVSSSSSDQGIREESNVSIGNLKSSSTLDNGLSLQSIPFEIDLLGLKSAWSIQTFVHDNLFCYRSNLKMFKIYTFCYQIPSKPRCRNLDKSLFHTDIRPRSKSNLTFSNTFLIQVLSARRGISSSGVQTIKIRPIFSIQRVYSETIRRQTSFLISNFSNEIPPTLTKPLSSPMTLNLRKLKTQLISLQTVFKNVSVGEIDKNSLSNNKCTLISKNNGIISKLMRNTYTQTNSDDILLPSLHIDPKQYLSLAKLDSLNLECEFIGASGLMIKQYPFYYEFIDKCYTEPHFDKSGKLEIFRPKEDTFKKAIVYASSCDEKYLAAINSVLHDMFRKKKNLPIF